MLENYQVVTMAVSTALGLGIAFLGHSPWERWHCRLPQHGRLLGFSCPRLSLSPRSCLLPHSSGSRGHELACEHPAAQLPGGDALARPCTLESLTLWTLWIGLRLCPCSA